MITFKRVGLSNFNEMQFNVLGDGTSTILKINLSKPPFNLNFNGILPSSAEVDTHAGGSITATAAIATIVDGDIMTITFSSAPSSSVALGPSILFIYNSLP